MAQQAVERKGIEKHEFVRTGRMALYGGGKAMADQHQKLYCTN